MERVQQCGDGKHRWIYRMSTLKNPTMMIRMGKILGVTLLVVYIVAQLASLIGEGEKPFLQTVEMLTPAILIILAVYIVSYLLWVLLCGGTYVCAFEMDDAGILHAQGQNKTEKQKLIEQMTVLLGAASPVIGILGGGLMASVNSSWKSSFFAVTSLKARRRYNAIYLNEPGCKNIIYVDDRDFDFVWSYIKARCDKAKIDERGLS